jgi:hypothetical protein
MSLCYGEGEIAWRIWFRSLLRIGDSGGGNGKGCAAAVFAV